MTLQSLAEDNGALRRRNALLEQSLKALTESLAVANGEAETFRRECTDLRLRLEALGVDGSGNDSKLQQRLLKAVSDLRLVQEERDRIAERLLALHETLLRFLKSATSVDPEVRLEIEAQMRSADEVLGANPQKAEESTAVAATLTDAMVISVKEELSLVVANVGLRQGVKMGMPFQVWRGDSVVGTVRVIDVRDRISGAVIQDLASEKGKVKVGDRLRVDARP